MLWDEGSFLTLPDAGRAMEELLARGLGFGRCGAPRELRGGGLSLRRPSVGLALSPLLRRD